VQPVDRPGHRAGRFCGESGELTRPPAPSGTGDSGRALTIVRPLATNPF